MINRLLELDSPVLYENMLPYLYEKRHLDRLLEYLVKDSLGTDGPTRDDTEFTDARCEKVNSFLTSNTTHLHSLLQHYNGSIVETVMRIFIHNNSRHTMNNYELSLFLRTLFVKLPNDILPYIDYDDILTMSNQLTTNRAIYDILVLLLTYPEKRSHLESETLRVDETETPPDPDSTDCFNVSPSILLTHAKRLAQHHILSQLLSLANDPSTATESRDLLCCLLCDTLTKYCYNPKYLSCLRELRRPELLHVLVIAVKHASSSYPLRLLDVTPGTLSSAETPVSPLRSRTAGFARQLYSVRSLCR